MHEATRFKDTLSDSGQGFNKTFQTDKNPVFDQEISQVDNKPAWIDQKNNSCEKMKSV